MVDWNSSINPSLSSKRSWLRRIRLSFHLHRRLFATLLFFLLSVTLVSLSYMRFPFIEKLQVAIIDVVAPLNRVVSLPLDWIKGGQQYLSDWSYAWQENKELKIENATLKSRLRAIEVFQTENRSLRRLLNVRASSWGPFSVARVFAFPGRPYVKSILIDAGAKQGVIDQQVVVDEDGLVGRVVGVGDHISRALLLTDLNSRVPVRIKGDNEHAILVGNNESRPFLTYAHVHKISVGSIVETSGEGGVFPQGIPVGTVEEIRKEKAYVRLFSSLRALEFVMLVRPVIDHVLKNLSGNVDDTSSQA